jgi:hypothetical protein
MPAVYVGAGGNSECSRDPGYFRAGVSDSCEFYVKKGKKKVANKKPVDLTKMGVVACTNCDDLIKGQPRYLPGSKSPICEDCFKNLHILLEEKKPTKIKYCDSCNHFEADKGYCGTFGKTNRTPETCDRFYPKEIPRCPELQVGQPKSQVAEVPKRSRCVNCGKRFKTTIFIKEGGEAVCFSCKKKEPPKPTCTVCDVVTENPIHERFLVVEARSCGSWTTTYVQGFESRENALRAIDTYNMLACKVFRISSSAPIELEELSLGYDIKVVKTVKR